MCKGVPEMGTGVFDLHRESTGGATVVASSKYGFAYFVHACFVLYS